MTQKMLKLFLLVSCSMSLQAESKECVANRVSCDDAVSCVQDTKTAITRKCHCTLCTRELQVCGCAAIGSLQVIGNRTVGGTLSVTGNETVGGLLAVAGNETVAGDMTINGTLITNTLVVGGLNFSDVVTGAENACTGTTGGLFINATDNTLHFKCIEAGSGITITTDSDTITISATSTAVIEPVVTTTTIGGILGYAGARNQATTVVATGGNAVFDLVEPSFSILPLTPDAASFTVPIGGIYYFQFIVRGTPDSSLTPPAPLAFELTSNLLAIPGSQFASDTQTTSLGASGAGATLAVKGFVVATLPAGAVIHLHNISGTPIQLNSTANKGATAGPVANSAVLIVERLT